MSPRPCVIRQSGYVSRLLSLLGHGQKVREGLEPRSQEKEGACSSTVNPKKLSMGS
jgi:hypothetical protein